MANDITGINNSLTPVNFPNRKESSADQGLTPVDPNRFIERGEPSVVVQVDTGLNQSGASSRELIQETSRIANAQQQRDDALNLLSAERDRLAESNELELPVSDRVALFANREQQPEQTLDTIQRIREGALAEPFGIREEDLGSLADNDSFLSAGDNALTDIDTATSALERQSTLAEARLNELQQSFNAARDNQLGPGSAPIESSEEAIQQAAQISEQIREQTPVNINGLSAEDRSAVLDVLQV